MTREAVEERKQSTAPKHTLVCFHVWVDLTNGDEYERYMKEYSTDTGSCDQFPNIPSNWRRENLSFSDGTGKSWWWRFHGPQSRRDKVEKSIEEFLEGFTYQFKDPPHFVNPARPPLTSEKLEESTKKFLEDFTRYQFVNPSFPVMPQSLSILGPTSRDVNTSGLFSGIQMNSIQHVQQQQQQFSSQSIQGGMGLGSEGGAGGLLQPLVPTLQQEQQLPQSTVSSGQPIGNASTMGMEQGSMGGGGAIWSTSIAGVAFQGGPPTAASLMTSGTATAGNWWSQNVAGMGPTQMQGGMGMGVEQSSATGVSANTGLVVQGGPPTATSLMTGGTGKVLMPPNLQQQQEATANKPAHSCPSP